MTVPVLDPTARTVVVREGEEECARFTVPAGAKVLHEMIRCNLRALPVGCRGGGCGVCRVRVLAGEYVALRMSRRHVSEADLAVGVVLACRIVPRTDLILECAPAGEAEAADTEAADTDASITGTSAPGTSAPGTSTTGTSNTDHPSNESISHTVTNTEPQEH